MALTPSSVPRAPERRRREVNLSARGTPHICRVTTVRFANNGLSSYVRVFRRWSCGRAHVRPIGLVGHVKTCMDKLLAYYNLIVEHLYLHRLRVSYL
eukprot:jgi/Botrbrau1/6910/Bobra.67_3s0028.1